MFGKTRVVNLVVLYMLFWSVELVLPSQESTKTDKSERPGVPPSSDKDCPPTHPIKGNFTTYSGERCIYHVEGQRHYSKTKPERCYTTAKEAILDGCRASKVGA